MQPVVSCLRLRRFQLCLRSRRDGRVFLGIHLRAAPGAHTRSCTRSMRRQSSGSLTAPAAQTRARAHRHRVHIAMDEGAQPTCMAASPPGWIIARPPVSEQCVSHCSIFTENFSGPWPSTSACNVGGGQGVSLRLHANAYLQPAGTNAAIPRSFGRPTFTPGTPDTSSSTLPYILLRMSCSAATEQQCSDTPQTQKWCW